MSLASNKSLSSNTSKSSKTSKVKVSISRESKSPEEPLRNEPTVKKAVVKSNGLNEESGFNNLLDIYNKNKDKKWDEWLVLDKIFPKPGKQGLVGLMSVNNSDEKDPIQFTFKISQYINYLVHHELTVMDSLRELSNFCPHFCRGIGSITCQIDPSKRKSGNPFEIECKYPIEKEVLLMEYLKDCYKFCNYITSPKISDNVIYSTIKQVLMAISIAQKKANFTHYDLHSNNIMMKKCDENLVFLYVLDKDTQFCVPTYGHYPVIIDFGFSYAKELNGNYLWPSMNHTDIGFLSDRFDHVADTKLFLVTVADELKATSNYEQFRDKDNAKKLNNIVRNVFNGLPIDYDSGWDNNIKKCASDEVFKVLKKIKTDSKLFNDCDYFCIDIIQTLIVLPLEPQSYKDIELSYTTFLNEFIKIEKMISSEFYCLYILKSIVDIARAVRPDYLDIKSRPHAVNFFKDGIYQKLSSIAGYCRPKGIHFEKMLCSLYCVSKCIEGILYNTLKKRWTNKLENYDALSLKTPEELFMVTDVNIPSDYQFNKNTLIFIINCEDNSISETSLDDDEIESINSFDSVSRGVELYSIIQNRTEGDTENPEETEPME